jgi:hypothetical protein
VFVGKVARGPAYIPGCDCQLVVSGTPVAKLRIENEMIPVNGTEIDFRSVSTVDSVDVPLVRRALGHCVLKSM